MAPSFAPGSNDPRVAYALGMVVKMLKTQARSSSLVKKPSTTGDAGAKSSNEELSCSSEKDAPVVIWQVKLEKLQRVLENPQVGAQQKQGLVDMIEDADSVQDVWTYLDGVGAGAAQSQSNNGGSSLPRSPSWANRGADVQATVSIPMELGCAICCSDLMLKPVSLACGHSFCKYCLKLWLANRANCPTCRQPIATSDQNNSSSSYNLHSQQQKQQQLSVNLALQHVIASFYPAQLQELEKQSQTERFEQLRRAIREALNSSDGEDLREILARLPRNNHLSSNRSANHQDQSLAVSLILESDVELQERVLAAEIHERLRKERLLRESSRRRHTAAYNTTGLSTQVDPAILNMGHNSTTTVRRDNSMSSMTNSGAAGKSSSSSTGGSSLLSSFMGRKS